MKKLILLVSVVMFVSIGIYAQKAEVLYFKANLPCCPGRACNLLESRVKSIVETNFSNGDIEFKTIRIADPSNKDLVEKHEAKSQTVVVVAKKRRKETIVDVSDIIRNYNRNRNLSELETNLVVKINEAIN